MGASALMLLAFYGFGRRLLKPSPHLFVASIGAAAAARSMSIAARLRSISTEGGAPNSAAVAAGQGGGTEFFSRSLTWLRPEAAGIPAVDSRVGVRRSSAA